MKKLTAFFENEAGEKTSTINLIPLHLGLNKKPNGFKIPANIAKRIDYTLTKTGCHEITCMINDINFECDKSVDGVYTLTPNIDWLERHYPITSINNVLATLFEESKT